MADGIEISGLAELQEKLDQLKTAQAERILRKGLREGAKWVQTAMQQRAPERAGGESGDALPPGALRNDIQVRTVYRGLPPGAAAVTVGPGKYTKKVARWVEFGHRLVRGGYLRVKANGKTRGSGKHVGDVQPHPFMRPAFEESKEVAVQAFARSVQADLEKLRAPAGGK